VPEFFVPVFELLLGFAILEPEKRVDGALGGVVSSLLLVPMAVLLSPPDLHGSVVFG
jgi:hypothetical protein